jgi:hypothetical protein
LRVARVIIPLMEVSLLRHCHCILFDGARRLLSCEPPGSDDRTAIGNFVELMAAALDQRVAPVLSVSLAKAEIGLLIGKVTTWASVHGDIPLKTRIGHIARLRETLLHIPKKGARKGATVRD